MAPDAPPAGAAGDDEAARQRAREERDEVARVIARRKREIIERECFGLIEFVEPEHDFRVVGGIEGVKNELQRIATAHPRGATPRRVPMGLLFTGPMGAGKTFVAEAFAKEIGPDRHQAEELPLQVGGRDRRRTSSASSPWCRRSARCWSSSTRAIARSAAAATAATATAARRRG